MKMKLYVEGYAGPQHAGDIHANGDLNNPKDKRYAEVIVVDARNRKRTSFVISRKALPDNTKPGDRLEIINLTQQGEENVSC